jgi:hypothetical protein
MACSVSKSDSHLRQGRHDCPLFWFDFARKQWNSMFSTDLDCKKVRQIKEACHFQSDPSRGGPVSVFRVITAETINQNRIARSHPGQETIVLGVYLPKYSVIDSITY